MRFPAPIRGIQSLSSHTVQQSSNDVLSHLLAVDSFTLNWRLYCSASESSVAFGSAAGRDRKLARHLPPSRSARAKWWWHGRGAFCPRAHGMAPPPRSPLRLSTPHCSSLALAPTTRVLCRTMPAPALRAVPGDWRGTPSGTRARLCLPPRATDGDHSAPIGHR
jgi:hypothetical protein